MVADQEIGDEVRRIKNNALFMFILTVTLLLLSGVLLIPAAHSTAVPGEPGFYEISRKYLVIIMFGAMFAGIFLVYLLRRIQAAADAIRLQMSLDNAEGVAVVGTEVTTEMRRVKVFLALLLVMAILLLILVVYLFGSFVHFPAYPGEPEYVTWLREERFVFTLFYLAFVSSLGASLGSVMRAARRLSKAVKLCEVDNS